MIVGVPRESFPGERRVALVPGVVPNLAKAGLEVVVEAGAGVEAGYPDAEYATKGAKIVGQPRRGVQHRRHHRAGAVLRLERSHRQSRPCRCCGAGQALIGFLRPLGDVRHPPGDRRHRRNLVLRRADAAHHARAEHGRALVHGHHLRLQGGAGRGRHAAPHLSHADHRGRHHHPVARAGHRRGRRRPAGHRHRTPPGRSRLRLRSAARGEGAGAEPGRHGLSSCRSKRPTRRMPAATPRRRTRRSISGSASCWARSSRKATW